MPENSNENMYEDPQPFNPRTFDQKLGEDLIATVQKQRGCFTCGSSTATSLCTGCKVAIYCNRSCQKIDWKRDHKESCGCYTENREVEAIPTCLKSCFLIDEYEFVTAMRERRDLFLSCASSMTDSLSFQTAVVYNLGAIYLVTAANFMCPVAERMHCVNRIMMEPIDHSERAMGRLYYGSGTLTTKTRALVVAKWLEFAKLVLRNGVMVLGITFGRGMMDFVEDKSFKNQLKAIGCQPFFIPSTDYLFV